MLNDIFLFSGLNDQQIKLIEQHGVSRKYPKNAVILSEQDPSDCLYVIESGRVKVFLSDESGKEVLLNVLERGQYYGELALIDGKGRSASVMTMEPCSFLILQKKDFKKCVFDNPELSWTLIGDLARRTRDLTERVRSLALQDVYGRVATALDSLAIRNNDQLGVAKKITHQELAARIGASREMVSRVMSDLNKGGFLESAGETIVIKRKLPYSFYQIDVGAPTDAYRE